MKTNNERKLLPAWKRALCLSSGVSMACLFLGLYALGRAGLKMFLNAHFLGTGKTILEVMLGNDGLLRAKCVTGIDFD